MVAFHLDAAGFGVDGVQVEAVHAGDQAVGLVQVAALTTAQIAGALARSLGLALSLLPFNADENMNDDLRNMVWKGHYMGYGPADMMITSSSVQAVSVPERVSVNATVASPQLSVAVSVAAAVPS